MRSQPLWLVGAPRSGTTFLAAVLNRHPMITLTSEARLFVLLKNVIEVDCARPDLLEPEHTERFRSFLESRAAGLIEGYYREALGAKTPIWGDKHPPYADPTVLSGRDGARPRLPVSGSCLRLIRRLLPRSKFIHILRDPAEVARSLLGKGWTASFSDGMAIWRQYVKEIDGFFAELDEENGFVMTYADLLAKPDETASSIVRFLDIADARPLSEFLRSERVAPTPFSGPVTDLAATYRAQAALPRRAGGMAAESRLTAQAGD